MGKESPAGVPGRRRVAGLRCLATMLFVLLVARCGGVEAGADIQGSAAPGRPNGILDKRQLVQKNFGFRPAPWWSDVTSAENGKDEQDGSDDGLSDGEPGATEPAYASRASKASKASKALKMKVLGAACNATVARPNGGCESGCCLGGKCVFCDLCGTPPPVGKSSPACRWCAAHGKALSEACLVRGDKCEFAKRTGRLADSACESGCCGVDGRCGFCDECRTCSYCRINGLLLNPDGRCLTRTRTTSRTKTTKTRTRTTSTVLLAPRGLGRGSGAQLTSCSRPGLVAMTFDDGPFQYTSALLDILRDRDVKASFFVNGAANSDIYDRKHSELIRRMVREGHCVASHGWKHVDMLTLDDRGKRENLRLLDEAFMNIIGSRPRFFRPPYGKRDQRVFEIAAEFGYDVAIWDIDTLDWEKHSTQSQLDTYKNEMDKFTPANHGFISLQHDIIRQTVFELVPRAIDYVRSRGYRLVSMGECVMGDSKGCWQ